MTPVRISIFLASLIALLISIPCYIIMLIENLFMLKMSTSCSYLIQFHVTRKSSENEDLDQCGKCNLDTKY